MSLSGQYLKGTTDSRDTTGRGECVSGMKFICGGDMGLDFSLSPKGNIIILYMYIHKNFNGLFYFISANEKGSPYFIISYPLPFFFLHLGE